MGIHPAILRRRGGGSFYGVLGNEPALVADMVRDTHRNAGVRQTFDTTFTTSRLGNATMTDSDGLLKWGPHNLLLYSEDFSNAAWTDGSISGGTRVDGSLSLSSSEGYAYAQQLISVTTGVSHTIEVDVTCDTAVANVPLRAGLGTSNDAQLVTFSAGETKRVSFSVTPSSGTLTIGIDARNAVVPGGSDETGYTVTLNKASAYRSDLGGMAPVPVDARVAGSTTYVPTTSTAKYLPRRHNHKYDGSAWVDAGTLIETEARTQLLHTTNTLVTQSHTVTAVPHTLHFTGTGTVTLSGASTAGPLVGTGTGEENRVSLTFTPTAASLTLTVTGTVTDAQLEVGSKQSSYIPNLAGSGTVNRAADSPLTIAGADVPWGSAGCIQMEGDMTYADTGASIESVFSRWTLDANNRIEHRLDTNSAATGQVTFLQTASGTNDIVNSPGAAYSPGINVPFNIASRHGSTFINGAVDGTALTEDTTPVALPDLSSTDLAIAYDFMGNVKQVRVWAVDIGDTGIAEASTS